MKIFDAGAAKRGPGETLNIGGGPAEPTRLKRMTST